MTSSPPNEILNHQVQNKDNLNGRDYMNDTQEFKLETIDTEDFSDTTFNMIFEQHKKAIESNHMEEAIQSLIYLQTHYDYKKLESYIIEFSDHIDPSKNTNKSRFFGFLPTSFQFQWMDTIADLLEKQGFLKAFYPLYDYIRHYPQHTHRYLIRTIKLLVLSTQPTPHQIETLVTDLFPRLTFNPDLPLTFYEQCFLVSQQFYLERRDEDGLERCRVRFGQVGQFEMRGLAGRFVTVCDRYYRACLEDGCLIPVCGVVGGKLGLDGALRVLHEAAEILRQASTLVDSNESWEEEFFGIIESYQLPFDLKNAVLLVQSDLALSAPSVNGNLSKALKLSQLICDRIEKQRDRYKKENKKEPSEPDIPLMFTFRVLYSIAIIYLLVGSLPQSTLEVAIILSVFPIPDNLKEEEFLADERECKRIASMFHEHEFGLMRVTQEGFVVRCLKHLIVSLDTTSFSKDGMAPLEEAIRWDEKAGQMIVLMQYGWSYWSNQTNVWQKIIQRIKEKKTFKNRFFLDYIYVPEILESLKELHQSKAVVFDIVSPEFRIKAVRLPSLGSILPVTDHSTMSPSWYSASTQKNTEANWMSPSFYYSHPETSIILAKRAEDELNQVDILTQCLDYRLRKLSPRIYPQRMKHVVQKFLRDMLTKKEGGF